MSKYERERDKIERKSTKENYYIPYSGKIKKRRSTVPNLLRVHNLTLYDARQEVSRCRSVSLGYRSHYKYAPS